MATPNERISSPIRVLASAVTLAMLVLTALVPAIASAGPTGKQLRAALDEVMEVPEGPPGLSVLIQRGERTQFRSRGVADLAGGGRLRGQMHMRIASMSKAFNGAVALALVSEGKLRLDDTIGQWLPGVLPLAENVTVRQALQHTGGLPDYIRDEEFIDVLIADPAQYRTPQELLEFVADDPLEFTPGSRYAYSDTDNVVVGLIAEAASGKTYDELLHEYAYDPLDLKRTSLPNTLAMPDPLLRGYEISADAPPEDVTELINPALAWASGGMVSTPRDVNAFFRAYVRGELFDRKTRRAQNNFVFGSSSPPGPGRNRATLALFRYETHCGTVYGHTGSFPGYRLFAAATKNGRRSVVFSVNSQIVPGQGSQEASDLIRHAQEDAVCHALAG